MYAPKKGPARYIKQLLRHLKEDIEGNTIIARNFNTAFSD